MSPSSLLAPVPVWAPPRGDWASAPLPAGRAQPEDPLTLAGPPGPQGVVEAVGSQPHPQQPRGGHSPAAKPLVALPVPREELKSLLKGVSGVSLWAPLLIKGTCIQLLWGGSAKQPEALAGQ